MAGWSFVMSSSGSHLFGLQAVGAAWCAAPSPHPAPAVTGSCLGWPRHMGLCSELFVLCEGVLPDWWVLFCDLFLKSVCPFVSLNSDSFTTTGSLPSWKYNMSPFFLAEKWVATLVKANTEGCYSLMDGADVWKELVNILNFHYLVSDFLFWIMCLRVECWEHQRPPVSIHYICSWCGTNICSEVTTQ